MSGVFKTLAIAVGLLVALMLALVIYITVVFDPNVLKPELEKLAAEQGIDLRMPGNVSWQWFPRLGVSLENVQVGEEPLMSIGSFAASVALRPLFHGQLVVEALSLVDLQLNLKRNAQGVANWESLMRTPAGDAPPAPASAEAEGPGAEESQTSPLVLAVEELRIDNATLSYRDEQQGTRIQMRQLDIDIDDLNLAGDSFQLRQMGKLSFDDWPEMTTHTAAELAVENDSQRLLISNLDVQLREDSNLIKLEVEGEVNLQQSQPNLSIKVQSFDLRPWLKLLLAELPVMAAEDALSRVALEARVSGAEGSWQVDGLLLQLDESRIAGTMGVESSGEILAGLEIDQLNLDRYLPPPLEAAQPQASAAAGALLPETPLDFSALQALQAKMLLSITKLQARDLQFKDAQVALEASSGQLKLSDLTAGFYQGHLQLKGSLDARQPLAQLQTSGQVTGVEIKPVLEVIAEEQRLSGAINGSFTAATNGASLAAWQRNLQAGLDLTANSLSLAQVDVERSACELAALINREPSPELAWKGLTPLRDVSLKAAVQGEQVKVESLEAGVENLALAARGKLNYASGKFEFPLDVLFVGEVDATRKCQVRERWRNKLLPMRCEGDLASLSARTCLPDRKRLDDLLRDELKGRAEEKIKTKLEEKLGTEKGQAVDQLLRGIFNK